MLSCMQLKSVPFAPPSFRRSDGLIKKIAFVYDGEIEVMLIIATSNTYNITSNRRTGLFTRSQTLKRVFHSQFISGQSSREAGRLSDSDNLVRTTAIRADLRSDPYAVWVVGSNPAWPIFSSFPEVG